jgi:hypothetical protein
MENKNGVIETYVNVFCDTYNQYTNRESMLKIWNEEFDYLDKEEYLLNFIKACKIILNNSTRNKMPSPGEVKAVIRENFNKSDKPLGEKPKVQKSVRQLFSESGKILGNIVNCNDYNIRKKLKQDYKNICLEMDRLSNKTRMPHDPIYPDIPGFIKDMDEDSYIDIRIKEGKSVDKSHIRETINV